MYVLSLEILETEKPKNKKLGKISHNTVFSVSNSSVPTVQDHSDSL